MGIIIRAADYNDYGGICRLADQLHNVHVALRPDVFQRSGEYVHRKEVEAFFQNEHTVIIVAEHSEGGIAGYTVLNIMEPFQPLFRPRVVVDMFQLAVDESFRGKGIGQLLVARSIDYARQIGASSLELGVYEDNLPARSFYNNLGFSTLLRRMEIHLG